MSVSNLMEIGYERNPDICYSYGTAGFRMKYKILIKINLA